MPSLPSFSSFTPPHSYFFCLYVLQPCPSPQLILFPMRQSDSFEKDPVIKNSKQQSNFRAIKQLIEAESSIRVAHNRIKVLQINEEKNNQRLNNQVGLIGKIQQTRELSMIHNHSVELSKKLMTQETQEARNKYLRLNSEQKDKIRDVYDGLKKEKKWQYLSIEEKSQEAERQIQETKRMQLEQKAKNRERIAEEEESAKKNLLKFHQSKQSRIKETKVSEVSLIKSREAQKYKELKDLSNVQMQLIQKQSQSQAAYRQVKNKLDSLLNNVKLQNTLSKKSLKTSIHLQGRENRLQS